MHSTCRIQIYLCIQLVEMNQDLFMHSASKIQIYLYIHLVESRFIYAFNLQNLDLFMHSTCRIQIYLYIYLVESRFININVKSGYISALCKSSFLISSIRSSTFLFIIFLISSILHFPVHHFLNFLHPPHSCSSFS